MKLTVVTYNTHRCIGSDGVQDPDRIAAVLREIDADVVALQEVDHLHGGAPEANQATHVAGRLGLRPISGPTVLREDGHYGNAVLTRLPVLAVRRHDLSVPGREPRGALDVTLACGPGRLRVVATHFGLRAPERKAQARRVLEEIVGPGGGAEEHDATILLGDFNVWHVFARSAAWLAAHFGHTPRPRTYPARFPLFRIDRIWVRPAAVLLSAHAHRSPLARLASDHLPVRGELNLSVGRPSSPRRREPARPRPAGPGPAARP
jgi:endonuclease/exonuclease/phosphatase family metal-dependent hydrolase